MKKLRDMYIELIHKKKLIDEKLKNDDEDKTELEYLLKLCN